jgi:hypothetical protein
LRRAIASEPTWKKGSWFFRSSDLPGDGSGDWPEQLQNAFAAPVFFGFNIPMKSAYELAMERLQKDTPVVPLTEEQRAQIAEIDSTYKAKIAEKELLLKDQIQKEIQAGRFKEVEPLQQQLTSELRRLKEECESRKEKVRNRNAK